MHPAIQACDDLETLEQYAEICDELLHVIELEEAELERVRAEERMATALWKEEPLAAVNLMISSVKRFLLGEKE